MSKAVPSWLADHDTEAAASSARWDGRDEVVLAMLVEADGHLLFGRPIHIEVTWPEGLPHGFTEESLRAWAAEELAKLRARQREWSA